MRKGSNWVKCDLHIHTPASFSQQYGDAQQKETWDAFITDLEALSTEFKIIGINDYLTLNGYKKVLGYKHNGRLQNIDCILPVIEFRINRFAGEKRLRRINYHVIFSSKIDVETIQSQFLNSIAATYTLENGSCDPDWSAALTDESLKNLGQRIKQTSPENRPLQDTTDWEVGFNNFNVDYKKLKDILARPQFSDRVITAIGKSEWNDFRWDGAAADKRSIINEADIIFLSCKSPEHFKETKEKLQKDQVNDLLLDCSDAHHYSDSRQKDRIGNCNTWLKIEPHFNGLKQVLFVPKERIRVTETHPDHKAPYQVIKSVKFEDGGNYFTNVALELSPGLNTIIGGKSTGKSLLASLIVNSSDPQEYSRRNGNDLNWIRKKQADVNFHVCWKDGAVTRFYDSDSNRKITYFPQHYLNSRINDKGSGNKELNKIIRNVLSQNETYRDAFYRYGEAVKSIDQEMAADASSYETKLRELRGIKHTSQEKGKSEDIQKNIDRLTQELVGLKRQHDLSEEELQRHQGINEAIIILEKENKILIENIEILEVIEKTQIQEALLPSNIFGDRYENLSDSVKTNIQAQVMKLASEFVTAAHDVVSSFLIDLRGQVARIKEELEEKQKENAPIITKIKDSEPIREKSSLIQVENKKLDEVKKIEGQINALNTELDEIEARLAGYLNNKISETDIIKNKITEHPFAGGDNQLGITIEHKCKSSHIQSVLKDWVRYQSNSEVKELINDNEFLDDNIDGYAKRLTVLLKQSRGEVLELKGDFKIYGIIHEVLSNAIYLNYDLKLGGDSFNIMSPGKRALALLRVLVELDEGEHPIVLDQPEDDLDNRSVYKGLATYLVKKKKKRQIIVVTHNPNVVVGADSEYVIVANQSGQESNQDNRDFHFEYVYGGLEDSFEDGGNDYVLEKQGIREHVCEILDGGKIAFKRREKLYSGFRKQL